MALRECVLQFEITWRYMELSSLSLSLSIILMLSSLILQESKGFFPNAYQNTPPLISLEWLTQGYLEKLILVTTV